MMTMTPKIYFQSLCKQLILPASTSLGDTAATADDDDDDEVNVNACRQGSALFKYLAAIYGEIEMCVCVHVPDDKLPLAAFLVH